MCKWTCAASGRQGLYKNKKSHTQRCIHCSPDLEQAINDRKEAEKENRITNIIQQDEDSLQLPWSSWSHHEPALQDMTGLYRHEFDYVHTLCEQQLIDARTHQHASKQNHCYMSTHNMLTLTLHWLHKAPSFRSLSKQFPSHSITTIERVVQRVMDILYEHLVPVLIQPVSSTAPSSRAASLTHVKLIIDSTFIPLPAAQKQPKYYHMKSPTKAALKVEIDCDLRHRIVCVSDVVNGSVHDMRLVRESGILDQMNDETKAIGDKGYVGQLGIITPAKKKRKVSREVAVLQDERERTHELESERAAIETINKRVKQWWVIRYAWQQKYNDFAFINKVVRVVCALVNLTLEEHPIRYERPPLAGR